MAVKTAQQHADEIYNITKKETIDPLYKQRKQNDQESIAEIDAALTKSAQSEEDIYQQKIDAQPRAYAEQLAANAFNEELGRQQAAERIANMGLTDSGFDRAQQSALAVQRSKANANARQSMNDYVRELETAIRNVWEKKDTQLTEQTLNINKTTNDWYKTMLAQLASDSEVAGAAAYQADVAAEAIKAQQQAALAVLAAAQPEPEPIPVNNNTNNNNSHIRALTLHEQQLHGEDDKKNSVIPRPTYESLYEDCNTYIARGAPRSEISNFIRSAYGDGYITKQEFNKLKTIFVPTTSGGRYAY